MTELDRVISELRGDSVKQDIPAESTYSITYIGMVSEALTTTARGYLSTTAQAVLIHDKDYMARLMIPIDRVICVRQELDTAKAATLN